MIDRGEIKTAIDIVDQWEDDQAGHVAAVLMWCGNEIAQLRSELAALKAENESLKKDAELWRSYQKRKQDLLDRGFLRSPLRADELDATAQGEKG